jgi:hypothetical protein
VALVATLGLLAGALVLVEGGYKAILPEAPRLVREDGTPSPD